MIRALLVLLVACGADPMILIVGPPPPAPPAPPQDKLVILIGDSHAVGLSIVANVTNFPEVATPFAAVHLFDHDAGHLDDPPIFVDEGPRDAAARSNAFGIIYTAGMSGLELKMARDLVAGSDNTWSFAKMTVSGSALVANWNAAGYPTAGPRLRTQLSTFITAQAAAFGVTDLANNMIVVCTLGTNDNAETYADMLAAFDDFFGTLRGTHGNFHVVLMRTRDKANGGRDVIAAEESFFSGDDNASIIYTDDIGIRGDGIHFDDNGYPTVGKRAAAAALERINGTRVLPAWQAAGPFSFDATTTPQTPTLPRHKDKDIIIVPLAAIDDFNYPLSDAQGFVEVANSPQHDSASYANPRLTLWWVRADQATMDANGGQMPAPTIGNTADSFGSKLTTAIVISGAVATGNPFEDTAGATAASSTAISTPSVTTSGPNRQIISFVALARNATSPQVSGWANAALTDVTEQVDRSTNTAAGYGLAVVTGRKATAGASGSFTATIEGASAQAMITLAVKP